MLKSKPTLLQFCPDGIPYQRKVLQLIRKGHDYSKSNLEIMLSGSVGSSKSVLLAHIAITHAMLFPKSRIAICRRSLPDLKETIFKEIIEHMSGDLDDGLEGLKEGEDYRASYVRGKIIFKNGSEIIPLFWADKKYKRPRSLKLSMAIIEEASENSEEDKEAFEEVKARIGRLPHVPENVLICATNPDSPGHWLYDYFIAEKARQFPNRHVFYSRTEDNIYLPKKYIQGLRRDMDARMALRLLDGQWIELTKDRVYYAYAEEKNFVPEPYVWNFDYPLHMSWDFNIGVGKPLSAVLFQYIDDKFHFGDEVVVEGMRTQESVEEIAVRGYLDMPFPQFVVNGDASGKHRDTRNRLDDYEIIVDFLSNYRTKDGLALPFRKVVPLSNPPLRLRHNKVNAYCENAEGMVRLYVYNACQTLSKGFRLVELLKGSNYLEDDKPSYQHVTTAAGYGIYAATTLMGTARVQRTIQL